jgi:hypothetical protein
MFSWQCIVIYPYNKNQQDALLTFNLFQYITSTCSKRLTANHRVVLLCICSNWYMSCVYVDWLLTGSCQQPFNINACFVYTIYGFDKFPFCELDSLFFSHGSVIYQFPSALLKVHNTNFDVLCSTLFPIVDEPKNLWFSINPLLYKLNLCCHVWENLTLKHVLN